MTHPALEEAWRPHLSRLSGFPRVETAARGTAASVAIALDLSKPSPDLARWFLTMRPASMRSHAGQYALPGGRIEDGENPLRAACRETHEEIGIHQEAWSGHAILDDFVTGSGFVVTPVVLWSFDPVSVGTLSQDEVERVFALPLDALRGEARLIGAPGSPDSMVHTLDVGIDVLFPPTGAILTQFRDIWFSGVVTRVSDFAEPPFARI